MDWNFIELDRETKFQLDEILLNEGELEINDIELLENDEEFEELDF